MKYYLRILYTAISMVTASNSFASTTYLDCELQGYYFIFGKKPSRGDYPYEIVSLEINDSDKYLEFKTINGNFSIDINLNKGNYDRFFSVTNNSTDTNYNVTIIRPISNKESEKTSLQLSRVTGAIRYEYRVHGNGGGYLLNYNGRCKLSENQNKLF